MFALPKNFDILKIFDGYFNQLQEVLPCRFRQLTGNGVTVTDRNGNYAAVYPRIFRVLRRLFTIYGGRQPLDCCGQAACKTLNMASFCIVGAVSIFDLPRFQEAENELGENDMAVEVSFHKRLGISQTVGFGDFFAGHLQKVETVALFCILQQAVNRKIQPALLRVSIR